MGADILMFKAHQVPVGRDQIQHIEMARDMAASFNHLYGEHLVLPQALVDDNVALLPGLDGRKMSKSYGNTIALFGPREQLRKQIMGIVTDSRAPGEPKSTEGSALYQIYRAFADDAEAATFAQAFADGIAWGDAKQQLFERIEHEIGPMRERYEALIAHPEEVERLLLAGAEKARAIATPFMAELRHAVGLRPLHAASSAHPARATERTSAPGSFKQYREADGRFYFKLVDSAGQLLLQSRGFASPRDAGQAIKRLQTEGAGALTALGEHLELPAEGPAPALREALEAWRRM
jgi:tryptophanyl-tRNA synthetase